MKRTIICRAIFTEYCKIGQRAVISICGADNPKDNVRMITDDIVTAMQVNKTNPECKFEIIDGVIETETEIFKTRPRRDRRAKRSA